MTLLLTDWSYVFLAIIYRNVVRKEAAILSRPRHVNFLGKIAHRYGLHTCGVDSTSYCVCLMQWMTNMFSEIWSLQVYNSGLIHCGLVTPYADTDLGLDSGNGLVTNGNKPLPEIMLTYHQSLSVIIIMVQLNSSEGNFTIDTSAIPQASNTKITLKIT